MSNELWTILVGASPIVEIRGAIPLALAAFNFSPLKVYFLSLLGNLLPVIPLLIFFNRFSEYLMRRNYYAHLFLTWLFERTRKKHTKKFEIWGSLALFAFTAIPLPFTGAWSACAAAFVFGVDFWKAAICISLGAATAGLIVLGLIIGINGLI